MTKYYCRSGGFRVVHHAADPGEAALMAVKKALDAMRDDGPGLGLLVTVSERGYDAGDAVLVPVIPLARRLGSRIALTPDEIADRYGLDLSDMDDAGRNWLLGE